MLQKTLGEYIKLLEDVQPEGPEDGPLQRYAFADQRRGKVPSEPNTKFEITLYKALIRHFEGKGDISPKLASKIQQFLLNGDYENIFHEPTQSWVCRGMAVPYSFMYEALKLDEITKDNFSGIKEANFTFTPNKGIGATSWTTSIADAGSFSGDNVSHDKPWRIIMIANVNENPKKFIVGEGGLYNVSGFDVHAEENEVIGLGEIKVQKLIWGRTRGELSALYKAYQS